jgi:ATP-dependent DNA helicase DinG
LAAVLTGHEERPEQLKMAREVERALSAGKYLLAEAGTGTGKTLAYLVPAILSGRKVIISTATKTLQEQIFFKDIPLLRDRLGLEFEAAYLKGRANYLCLLRFEKFDQAPQFSSREESMAWPRLREWALTTSTGDRSEVQLPESFSAWPEMSATAETCLGPSCPLYEPCHLTGARRRAADASVVVVNHHLFFADLAIRGAAGEGVLPEYDAVIFDEAHALEDVATEHFGTQVSSFRMAELASDTLKALPQSEGASSLALSLRGQSEELFSAIARTLGLARESQQRIHKRSLERYAPQVHALSSGLKALSALASTSEEPTAMPLARRAAQLADDLEFICAASSEDCVFWAQTRARTVALCASPIDIAQALKGQLYGKLDTAIFTSATLTASGRFDYFVQRMGLDGLSPREIAVPSPFDYPRQAALYLPGHLPEPQAPGFVEALAEELFALCRITGGRAFLLFTSLKNMEAAHRLLHHRLDCQVLLQGERPKSALLEAFQREPSVLFAAHSFWEGVDVPGEALSLVAIDKLPFAPPNEPLTAARIDRLKSRGEDAFNQYQLPQAALALRQGFGRLIRRKDDRGIVAVMDNRIVKKSYGRTFLQSLPEARRFEALAPLETWYRRSGK